MKKIICLTGLDGCGKSTQAELLCRWLEDKGVLYKHIRMQDIDVPSKIILKKSLMYIRKNNIIAQSDIMETIMIAFRTAYIFQHIIMPCLNNGTLVLLERYIESDKLYMTKKKMELYHYNQIIKSYIEPAICNIYIKVPVDICFSRVLQRGNISEHENLNDLKFAESFFDDNREKFQLKSIDGTKQPDFVFNKIREIVETCIEF